MRTFNSVLLEKEFSKTILCASLNSYYIINTWHKTKLKLFNIKMVFFKSLFGLGLAYRIMGCILTFWFYFAHIHISHYRFFPSLPWYPSSLIVNSTFAFMSWVDEWMNGWILHERKLTLFPLVVLPVLPWILFLSPGIYLLMSHMREKSIFPS